MTGAAEPRADAPADIIDFKDNGLTAALCGPHDSHLARLEGALGVRLSPRGNRIAVNGGAGARAAAIAALNSLYKRLEAGLEVGAAEVDAAARHALVGPAGGAPRDVQIKTPKRVISPRSPAQAAYLRALSEDELIFGVGPAGTGKTYLAVAAAVSMLAKGEVERLILSRPAVEAGERIGFLPGDMKDKVDPYLRPLYDALFDMMPGDQVEKRLADGVIEIAPLAFMRGRTLSRAFVILDEAQNATVAQMKMFLTRLGEGSRMAVTGDPSQSDLPRGETSGLADALDVLAGLEGVRISAFTKADIVRHALVARIVEAYDAKGGGR
ncbi:MAG: PhoH family protein [Pseudomonadota bacterium]